MQIVIDIPQGLKIDFENENWTVLTCAEMKNALEKAVLLPKGHGRLIDADKLYNNYVREPEEFKGGRSLMNLLREAPTIIEADKEVEKMSKVNYEVRRCDCCHDLFIPGEGVFGNYELTCKGEIVDLCPKCKHNLIVYVNTHIEGKKEEE